MLQKAILKGAFHPHPPDEYCTCVPGLVPYRYVAKATRILCDRCGTLQLRGHECAPSAAVTVAKRGSVATDGETPAFREAEARARDLVKLGRSTTLSAALTRVWEQDHDLDRGALYKRHVEERASPRTKARLQAIAKANTIWHQVEKLAEQKVAAGQAPDVHAAIEQVWKETGLYEQYKKARRV